jgi:hypothetical protein
VTGRVLLVSGLTDATGTGPPVNGGAGVTPTEAFAGGDDTGVLDPGGMPEATALSLTLPLLTSAWVTR